MHLLVSLLLSFFTSWAYADLNIYTDRSAGYLRPIADQFTQKTGVQVNILEDSAPNIILRLKTEGAQTPADLVWVKDMVYLADLVSKNLLQPMKSSLVLTEVAPAMQDPNGLWTAITIRPRTVVYNPARVSSHELSGYADLASEKWAGRLCLRTSQSSYNEALVASLVAHMGEQKAKEVIKGWVDNLAQPVFSNDRLVLDAIANGQCEVGVVNSYYLAGKIAETPNFPVKIFFTEQSGRGVHVNGTGAGIVAASKNAKLATQFIELMLTDANQLHLSESHLDYPAKMNLPPSTFIKEWGAFKADFLNWNDIGQHIETARQLMNEVSYQ